MIANRGPQRGVFEQRLVAPKHGSLILAVGAGGISVVSQHHEKISPFATGRSRVHVAVAGGDGIIGLVSGISDHPDPGG